MRCKTLLLTCLLLLLSSSSFALPHRSTHSKTVGVLVKQYPHILSAAKNLKTKVFNLALKANVCAQHKGLNRKNIITIIDYTIPSDKTRFWVLDLNKDEILFALDVAHGKGSGDRLALKFSDRPKSHKSSLGVFITGDTYYGKHGLSLELFGMEPGFNAHAHARRVVVHAAWYATRDFVKKYGYLGRSWGCPAIDPKFSEYVIDSIHGGTLLFNYYTDKKWLTTSKYLHCKK